MIAFTITALLTVTACAVGLALIDNWLRGRNAFNALMEERALLRAGFVPMVEAIEQRNRASCVAPHSYRASRNGRPRGRVSAPPAFTKRTARSPRRAIAPLGEALGVA